MDGLLKNSFLSFRGAVCVCLLALIQIGLGQNSAPSPTGEGQNSDAAGNPQATGAIQAGTEVPSRRLNQPSSGADPLLIGPGDELDVTVYGAPDLSGHARV